MSESHARYGRDWLELHPSWELREWRDADAARLEMTNRAAFDAAVSGAAKADILRLEILLRHGGVYLDTDFEPMKNIEPLLWNTRAFVGWHNATYLNNAVMGAVPNHPYIRALALAVRQGIADYETLDLQTGPGLLTRVRFAGNFPDLREFGPDIFYPYDWNEEHRANESFPDAFAVHHWAKSWVPKQSRAINLAPIAALKASVVIPFGGSLSRLRLTLAGLASQSERDFEILVVDDATDCCHELDALCAAHGARCILVPLEPGEEQPRTAKVRNIGAQNARSDVLLFCDQDCIPDPDWVGKHVSVSAEKTVSYNLRRLLSERDFAAFEGADLGISNWKKIVFDSGMEDRKALVAGDPVLEFRSHGFCVRRDDFLAIGGFDMRYDGAWGSEDTDLASRMRRADFTFHRMCWGAWQTHLGHPFLDCAADGRTQFLQMIALDPHCPVVANGGPLTPIKENAMPLVETAETAFDVFDRTLVPLTGTLPENGTEAAKRFAICTLTSEDEKTSSLFDDWLGSLLARGGLDEDCRIVVFAGSETGEVPVSRSIVEAHKSQGTKTRINLIPVVSKGPMCVKSKTMLYSAHRWLSDEMFLVMDCDILILKSLAPLLRTIEMVNGVVLAGNSAKYLGSFMDLLQHYFQGDLERNERIDAICSSIPEDSIYKNVRVGHGNTGVVGGRRELFKRLEEGLLSWKDIWKPFEAQESSNSPIDEILVLTTLEALHVRIEASQFYNYCLWCQEYIDQVRIEGFGNEMRAFVGEDEIVLLHFTTDSKQKKIAWRGAFCAPNKIEEFEMICLRCKISACACVFAAPQPGEQFGICLDCAGAPMLPDQKMTIELAREELTRKTGETN